MDWRKDRGNRHIAHLWAESEIPPSFAFYCPGWCINGKWKHSRSRGKYLFKVESLSNVFRARFVEEIRKLAEGKKINGQVPDNLFDKNWVVYAKQAFGGPKQVINYLGRYTHRTAISNDRILEVNNEEVTFTWKDYNKNYDRRTTTLAGEEFLRLFCMHILPPGFTRIRHYGFLSSASKKKSLGIIRKALKVKVSSIISDKPLKDVVLERMGIKPGICRCCGHKMEIVQLIPNKYRKKQRAPPPEQLMPNKKFSA